MKPFTVGIVGAGEIVQSVHLPTLLANERARVAWILDADGSRARAVANAFRLEAFGDAAHLRALPAVDVVLLALPYGARAAYYEYCAERGAGAYVEKPFARTREEHAWIASHFEPYALAVGLQRRSWSTTGFMQNVIRSKLFGQLREVRCGFGGPGIVTAGRYSTDVRMAGGGILMEMGVHGLDAILYITDAVAARVDWARVVTDEGFDIHVDGEATLTLREGDEVPVQLTFTYLEQTSEAIEFHFDSAVVSFDWTPSGTLRVRTRNGRAFTLADDRGARIATVFPTFHAHWSRCFDAFEERAENYTSAGQTLLTTGFIEDLYSAGKVEEEGRCSHRGRSR